MTGEALYEAIGQMDDRYIEEANAFGLRKPPLPRRLRILAACLCLVCIGSMYLLLQRLSAPSDIGAEPHIIVNKLQTPPPMGDIDAQMEHYIINAQPVYESEEAWEKMKRDFKANIGEAYDAFTARIPEIMYADLNYYTLWSRSSFPDGDYTLHDYIFSGSSGDTRIRLAISHIGKPMRCWIISTNTKPSVINGTAVTVSGRDDDYYVTFEKNGIFYDIEANNLTLVQLEALLVSLTAE